MTVTQLAMKSPAFQEPEHSSRFAQIPRHWPLLEPAERSTISGTAIFWDVMPSSLVDGWQRFGGTYYIFGNESFQSTMKHW